MQNSATVIILYVVAIGIVAAAGLWPVAAAMLLLVVAAALLNKGSAKEVRNVSTGQIQIVERVSQQLSLFGDEITRMRDDLNRGLWSVNEQLQKPVFQLQENEHFLALANRVIDIENKLNRIKHIVEPEQAPQV